MSELSGIATMTTMLIAIGEETTADTDAQADDDKVLHTVGTTKGILSQSRDMCIIRQAHSQSDTVAQHGRQGYDTLPGQVGRILNTPRDRTGTGTTDANRTDGLITTILLNHHYYFLAQCRYKIIHIRIVFRGKSVFSQNITSDIHHRIGCSLDADIHTDDLSFDIILLHP